MKDKLYKSWLLRAFRTDPEWNEFITVVLDEIIQIKKSLMGTTDSEGVSGDVEDVSLSTGWEVASAVTQGPLSYQDVAYTGAPFTLQVGKFLIKRYDFIPGRYYSVQIKSSQNVIGKVLASLGGVFVANTNPIYCSDHYIIIKSTEPVLVEDIIVTAVENSYNYGDRKLLLAKIIDYDKATTFVLNKMSVNEELLKVSGLPDILKRQFLKSKNDFYSKLSTSTASTLFFYFLGYVTKIQYLYARRGDYSATRYSYIPAKPDEFFMSSGDIFMGRILSTKYYSDIIEIEYPHRIVEGDQISTVNYPFTEKTVKVIKVDKGVVYLDRPVNVTEGDILDVYRLYSYSVNPDPVNYFKTSHIDVFFKQNIIPDLELDFLFLKETFYQYLPSNVVIRFFGYREEIGSETLSMSEISQEVGILQYDEVLTQEIWDVPEDPDIYVVWGGKESEYNGVDVFGIPVALDSFVMADKSTFIKIIK